VTDYSSTRFINDSRLGVDMRLLGLLAVLLMFGLLMVYSSTIASSDKSLQPETGLFFRQLSHVCTGLIFMVMMALTPIDLWERFGKWILIATIILLAFLVIPGVGHEVNGSKRWIGVAGFRFQPAEFAKLAVVIYIAGYLTRMRTRLESFSHGVVMIGIVMSIIGLLLLAQPDFGSFVVITVTVGVMMFLGGVRIWHMLLCVSVTACAFTLMVVMAPYRMARVLSFTDPFADPFNSGFQLVQALIAVGRGELFGVGLGGSIQKLYYLPHANNDFILAIIGEELGFLGISFVVFLFGPLLWLALQTGRLAAQAGYLFAARLAEGVGVLLVVQALINIGVNLGVLPTKGLTLPFISYGGSSMLMCCAATGLLLAVQRQCLYVDLPAKLTNTKLKTPVRASSVKDVQRRLSRGVA
jgi:cell division protein FtsW